MDDSETMDISSDDVATLDLGFDPNAEPPAQVDPEKFAQLMEDGPQGDPDQEPAEPEHGSASAATAPKPPTD